MHFNVKSKLFKIVIRLKWNAVVFFVKKIKMCLFVFRLKHLSSLLNDVANLASCPLVKILYLYDISILAMLHDSYCRIAGRAATSIFDCISTISPPPHGGIV